MCQDAAPGGTDGQDSPGSAFGFPSLETGHPLVLLLSESVFLEYKARQATFHGPRQ